MADISQLKQKIATLKAAEQILLEEGIQSTSPVTALPIVAERLEHRIVQTLPREVLEHENDHLSRQNIELKLELDNRTRQMNRIIADLKLELSQRPQVFALHNAVGCCYLVDHLGQTPVFATEKAAREYKVAHHLSDFWRVTAFVDGSKTGE